MATKWVKSGRGKQALKYRGADDDDDSICISNGVGVDSQRTKLLSVLTSPFLEN